jgi:hypothetical protein
MLKKISLQIPPGIVVQFHRDGDALLYPRLGEALYLFKNNIRNVVTNGKLLVDKADEIIGNMETLSISIFEDDTEAVDQRELIREFLSIKKEQKPFVTLRLIGMSIPTIQAIQPDVCIPCVAFPNGQFQLQKR